MDAGLFEKEWKWCERRQVGGLMLDYNWHFCFFSLVVQEPSSYITNLLIYFNVIVPSNEYIRQQQDASMLVSRIPYNFNIFSDIRESERYVRARLPLHLSFPMIGVHSGWSDLNRDGKFYQESCFARILQ